MEDINQSELAFHLLVESFTNAIVLINKSGLIISANVRALNLFGYRLEEFAGQPIESVILNSTNFILPLNKSPFSIIKQDLYGKDKNGLIFSIKLDLNLIITVNGNVVLASILDMRENNEQDIITNGLAQSVYDLSVIRADAKKNQEKNIFKEECISHEFRTPINAIISFIKLLKEGACGSLTSEQQECINGIFISSNHLHELVNDVLNIETGESTLNPTIFNIKKVINDVLQTLKPLIDQDKIEILYNLTDVINIVYLDKNKFVQILYNLLSNAIKFNKIGGIIKVSIEEGNPGFFVLSVTDSGMGINKEDLLLLFTPFKQFNNHKGTGLGLTITQKLVRLHRGSIRAESREYESSTFIVILPLYYTAISAEILG